MKCHFRFPSAMFHHHVALFWDQHGVRVYLTIRLKTKRMVFDGKAVCVHIFSVSMDCSLKHSEVTNLVSATKHG